MWCRFLETAHELGGDAERPRLSLSNSSTDQGGGTNSECVNNLISVTDKFVPSEGHNETEIMSAPPQVGGSGDETPHSPDRIDGA